MRQVTQYFLWIFCLSAGFNSLYSHTDHGFNPRRYNAYVHLVIGVPQGEFQMNVEDVGVGIGFGGGVYLGEAPIMLGGQLQFMTYGSETRRTPLSLTIPDIMVDVTTSNNIGLFHLIVRLQNKRGWIRPYLDGITGGSYFFTETSLEDINSTSGENKVISSTHLKDWVSSYGVGGGLMIHLGTFQARNEKDGSMRPYDLSLDIGFRYLHGGEATYLKKGRKTIQGTTVVIDPLRSKTDMAIYRLGVAFTF